MTPYQVLVVDDSAFMRKIISDLIEKDPEFQVAGTASTGREAIETVARLKPDIVTMDVEMPEMNGLEALKSIMASRTLPVIMLSGINEQGMKETIMALEWGAFDFIRKPSVTNSQDISQVGEELRMKLREAIAARRPHPAASSSAQPEAPQSAAPAASPVTRPADAGRPAEPPARPAAAKPAEPAARPQERPAAQAEPKPAPRRARAAEPAPGRPGQPPKSADAAASAKAPGTAAQPKPSAAAPAGSSAKPAAAAQPPQPPAGQPDRKAAAGSLRKLVAVGTSTGGPRALKALLEKIPADFPAPVVIVQHMPASFTKSLAQRLNTFSPLEVVEAEQGMVLKQGMAYIAPGGYHMRIVPASGGQYAVSLNKEETRNGHRPSVDTLFESLLPLTSLERHAVLMTGMGNDGAKMMKALYDSGVTSTFAESEETCVVYGMPRSAVELGCVTHILPLQSIAPKLTQIVK